MIRVGLVGLSSGHMTQFADHVAAGLLGDAQVTHAVREDTEFAAALDVEWVDSVEELAEAVDAGIVGGKIDDHRAAHAIPLLAAGLPVLVDKPLANNRDDVEAIFGAGGKLFTASALRYQPSLAGLTLTGDPVVVTGNADRDSPWSGLLFHGLHVVELAATVLCGDQPPIARELVRVDEFTVSMVLGGRRSELRFVPDAPQYTVDGTPITLQPGYLAGVIEAFAPFAHGGPAPLSVATMRATLDLVFACIDLLEQS